MTNTEAENKQGLWDMELEHFFGYFINSYNDIMVDTSTNLSMVELLGIENENPLTQKRIDVLTKIRNFLDETLPELRDALGQKFPKEFENAEGDF